MIKFHIPYTDNGDSRNLNRVLKNKWLTMGIKTIEFEQKFLNFINNHSLKKTKYSLAVNSCTSAIHLALVSLSIKKNDEVIISSNTFVSVANVIKQIGAKPILCDIDYQSGNIDLNKIEKLITKKTKAIIPVHYAGRPFDIKKLLLIKKKYKLKIIEDAAHCIPTFYFMNHIGCHGFDFTCFSFYATKTLSTGEGGMLLTNNKKYYDKILKLRLHGMSKNAWSRYNNNKHWKYDVDCLGFKYNTTDINSSLGINQIKKILTNYKKRIAIVKRYQKNLKDINQVKLPLDDTKNLKSAWHLFVIKVEKKRDQLITYLRDKGVQCSVHYPAIYKFKIHKSLDHSDLNIIKKFNQQNISLPIYPSLTISQVDYICKKIINFYEKK